MKLFSATRSGGVLLFIHHITQAIFLKSSTSKFVMCLFKACFLSTLGCPDKGMHLHCVLATEMAQFLNALVMNVCPHNEVILSVLLVVFVFCKIKIFLVRGIGCSIEESCLKSAFRHDLMTNMKEGVCFLKFSFSPCVNFPLIVGFMHYKILCL